MTDQTQGHIKRVGITNRSAPWLSYQSLRCNSCK